jgi:hypothetical protein
MRGAMWLVSSEGQLSRNGKKAFGSGRGLEGVELEEYSTSMGWLRSETGIRWYEGNGVWLRPAGFEGPGGSALGGRGITTIDQYLYIICLLRIKNFVSKFMSISSIPL